MKHKLTRSAVDTGDRRPPARLREGRGSGRPRAPAAAPPGEASVGAHIEREGIQRLAAQLKTLYHMGRDLGEDENWSDALDRFLMALVSFMHADGAGLLLFSGGERSLSARATFHLGGDVVEGAIETIRSAWQRHARGTEIHCLESYGTGRETSCLERAEPWRVTIVPLRHRGRALGFLLLDKAYSGGAEFEREYHFLSTLQTIFAEEIASASYISELRQLSRFNNKVLDNIRSGVVTTDLDGNIRYANSLASETCPRVRRTRRDAQAVHFDDLFRIPLQPRGPLARFLESQRESDVCEVECHGRGETPFPARLRMTRMHDDNVNGTVVVGIFEDLSEHKKMEEAIRRNDRLRSLGQLSASVAHEIRNPLAGIATTAEVLGEKLRGDESTARHIQTMLSEISRLDGIVRNLLAFAKPPRPQLAPCDASEIVARVMTLVTDQAASRSVRVDIDGSSGGAVCLADPAQLTQVVLNLVLNAVQACGAGDTVTVSVWGVESPERETVAEIRVTDTGPGVPETVRTSLFEPFVTTKTQGTGLGLAICRQIVEDHGGAISCEFLERGTRFTVRVPAFEAPDLRPRANRAGA